MSHLRRPRHRLPRLLTMTFILFLAALAQDVPAPSPAPSPAPDPVALVTAEGWEGAKEALVFVSALPDGTLTLCSKTTETGVQLYEFVSGVVEAVPGAAAISVTDALKLLPDEPRFLDRKSVLVVGCE